MSYNSELTIRQELAIRQAADMWLNEWDLGYDSGKWDNPAVQATYDMAIEILAAFLDLDAKPAKARLDHAITEMYRNQWMHQLPPPQPRSILDFDQCERAGVDGTSRFLP